MLSGEHSRNSTLKRFCLKKLPSPFYHVYTPHKHMFYIYALNHGMKWRDKKVAVRRPWNVKEYNSYLGGVDLLDSLSFLYKFPIKSRRWYMNIFYHTVTITVVNTWLWYKRHALLLRVKPMKQSSFQSMISDALVQTKKVGRPSACTPPHVKLQRKVPVPDARLDGCGHLPEWTAVRQRCKNRNCQALGHITCSKCRVHLCLSKDRNCFTQFCTFK